MQFVNPIELEYSVPLRHCYEVVREIAEMVDQESDKYGFTQSIYAKPKANLHDLEHVILLE